MASHATRSSLATDSVTNRLRRIVASVVRDLREQEAHTHVHLLDFPPHGLARLLDLHNRPGIAAAVATRDGLAGLAKFALGLRDRCRELLPATGAAPYISFGLQARLKQISFGL